MAPVANRLTIDSIGSTSSRGIGVPANLKSKSPRRVQRFWFWLSTRSVYSLKILYWPLRVACWSLNTVSGLKRWYSPSRRHWYSPPQSSSGFPTGRSGKACWWRRIGAPVGLDRGDPHLGDDLQDPFVQRLDVVLRGLRVVHPWE